MNDVFNNYDSKTGLILCFHCNGILVHSLAQSQHTLSSSKTQKYHLRP